ncbi:radical SAM protein [Desulfobulbus alkaliphilus]|uniref:radical SAM protein n=1 Tax=Desulfobulbus alkaliphilus TaxID=869814 RepID=UPI0019642BED|nr:radical SAM protein [Desulfobulbus alkaliphilus]MBM9536115.1 radical SAM protein [Desulfobulbus alkaliphilus]
MRYEGPIYRPPSEADSLLVQVTTGCPHNRCSFCMVYKKGPYYRVRPATEVIEDLETARAQFGSQVRTIFFPAGNTLAAPTKTLEAILVAARRLFPEAYRLTVYGSARYILDKGEVDLRRLAQAGLNRVHVGLESGHDGILAAIRKGADRSEQIRAGRMLKEAGVENSTYVMLGIGGQGLSSSHALETAAALNDIEPDYVRLRTFVPKEGTPLLRKVQTGEFIMAGPHTILGETRILVENMRAAVRLRSDHYTNYINLSGELPHDKDRMLACIDDALKRPESTFRPFFIGRE